MRTALLVAALSALRVTVHAPEREVTIDGGRAPLHGALLEPEGTAHKPAVLLIAGSGPTDRNGNSTMAGVSPATLKLLAEGLAADGITTLRYDKRGVGGSAAAMSSESDLRFTIYVDDAVAWSRFLATRPHVSCVVIVGHSEGALIAAMAAQKTPVCGVVELSGAGRPAGVVLREQLKGKLPPDLDAKAEATLAQLEAGRTVADAPLPALFRPSVQPYLISWLPIDPAAELSKVKAPVLIVQGGRDLQVSAVDAHDLAKASPGAQFEMLADANHVLKDVAADTQANMAAYADPSLPLDPRLVALVAAFVKGAGASR